MGNGEYLLGHDEDELRRLEQQAAALAPATTAILRLAGISPGMRVLDLGSGAGDVVLLVADLVGPSGSVVGVDQSADALAWARRRVEARGLGHVELVEGELHTVDLSGPFDAVVGRLVLLYVPDPVAVLRRYVRLLVPGGTIVSMEYEMTAAGPLPGIPEIDRVAGWITEAFRRSGLDPLLGSRLGLLYGAAGLPGATVLGLQAYLLPGSEAVGTMPAGVVRTLLPVIEREGIASAEEVGIDTLAERIRKATAEHDAVFRPPTLVGAWAQRPPGGSQTT